MRELNFGVREVGPNNQLIQPTQPRLNVSKGEISDKQATRTRRRRRGVADYTWLAWLTKAPSRLENSGSQWLQRWTRPTRVLRYSAIRAVCEKDSSSTLRSHEPHITLPRSLYNSLYDRMPQLRECSEFDQPSEPTTRRISEKLRTAYGEHYIHVYFSILRDAVAPFVSSV